MAMYDLHKILFICDEPIIFDRKICFQCYSVQKTLHKNQCNFNFFRIIKINSVNISEEKVLIQATDEIQNSDTSNYLCTLLITGSGYTIELICIF